MTSIAVRSVFDVVTDFLVTSPSPQEMIDYRFPEDIQEYASYLLDLRKSGTILPEQEEVLFEIVRADNLLALLKAKAYRRLKDSN